MNAKELKTLDNLIKSQTAFTGYQDMKQAMEGGYTPTIHPVDAKRIKLIAMLQQLGHKVFMGRYEFSER